MKRAHLLFALMLVSLRCAAQSGLSPLPADYLLPAWISMARSMSIVPIDAASYEIRYVLGFRGEGSQFSFFNFCIASGLAHRHHVPGWALSPVPAGKQIVMKVALLRGPQPAVAQQGVSSGYVEIVKMRDVCRSIVTPRYLW